VAIYGGFVGNESLRTGRNPNPATNGTVLSGDLSRNDTANWGNRTDNSLQVVSASGTDASAILDGFTISGGCHDNSYSPWGPGMTCEGSPTLANLVFAGNRETNLSGGGMFVGSGTPSLTNVTFIGNRSTSGNGGGMYIDGDQGRAAVSLTNAVFSGNEASSTGGAVYICSANGSVSLTNVTFCGNAGGARWVDDAITIFNSLVLPTYSVGGDAVESQQDRYL
jgi:predicted outer membrane repeat protein